MIAEILAVLAAPSALDSCLRWFLFFQSRRPLPQAPSRQILKWLVLVPARGEGNNVERTLDSISRASRPGVTTRLVLDGEDPVAMECAARLGISAVVKSPAGPTKGKALAWVAREHTSLIRDHEAVLILDVGSTIAEDFFERFRWPGNAHGVQTLLSGQGEGVGSAAALSERMAQQDEDFGRERIGWNVRLRGTGTALMSSAFTEFTPLLRTRVEDTELSLLMTARGKPLRLERNARVFDTKPQDIDTAAAQRARWFAGKLEIMFHQAGAVARLMARRPLEGIGFVSELFGRPFSLTALIRIIAGILLMTSGGSLRLSIGAFLLLSGLLDVLRFAVAGNMGDQQDMVISWGHAITRVPRAFAQWIKGRKL